MVVMTMIARVADGLPLAASMTESEQVKFTKKKTESSLYFKLDSLSLS